MTLNVGTNYAQRKNTLHVFRNKNKWDDDFVDYILVCVVTI